MRWHTHTLTYTHTHSLKSINKHPVTPIRYTARISLAFLSSQRLKDSISPHEGTEREKEKAVARRDVGETLSWKEREIEREK